MPKNAKYYFKDVKDVITFADVEIAFEEVEPMFLDLVGSDGKDGKDGKDGRDGKDGLAGPTGPAGKDGVGLRWMGIYKPSETYSPNDLVEYLGSSYICVVSAKGKPPNQSRQFWNLFSAAGASGASGPQGEAGPTLGVPTFMQETQPDYEGSYVWVQTGLGADGTDYTVYYNIC